MGWNHQLVTSLSPRSWFRLCLTSIISVLFVSWACWFEQKPTWGVPAFLGNDGLLENHGHGIFPSQLKSFFPTNFAQPLAQVTKMGAARQSAQATLNYFRHLGLLLHYWRILEVPGSFWFERSYASRQANDTPTSLMRILPFNSNKYSTPWKFDSQQKPPCTFTKGPKKARFALSSQSHQLSRWGEGLKCRGCWSTRVQFRVLMLLCHYVC